MVSIQCGNCGKGLRFDKDKIQATQVGIVCPICKHKNIYTKPVVSEKTVITGSINQMSFGESDTRAYLIMHTEDKTGVTFELKKGKYILGRKSEISGCELEIEEDLYVSRQHCRLELVVNHAGIAAIQVEDLNSTNGTFVNTKQLHPSDIWILSNGDTLQVGRTKFVIQYAENSKSKGELEKMVAGRNFEKTVII